MFQCVAMCCSVTTVSHVIHVPHCNTHCNTHCITIRVDPAHRSHLKHRGGLDPEARAAKRHGVGAVEYYVRRLLRHPGNAEDLDRHACSVLQCDAV